MNAVALVNTSDSVKISIPRFPVSPSTTCARSNRDDSPRSIRQDETGRTAKGTDSVLDDARAIRDGGGNGSIIGRNCFQRPRAEALALLQNLVDIYKGKA